MALNTQHPSYVAARPDWDTMRDVYRGERHVKSLGVTYLPPTQGMVLDGFGNATLAGRTNVGQQAYDAYRMRAVMPDNLKDAVDVFMGLLHSQPPKIELPPAMEAMRDKATQNGESLEQLLRRINEEQLVTGRLGLLLDLPMRPDPANPLPYISLYITEAITNWDDGEIEEGLARLNMVVLDESGYKRQGFEWLYVTKYRVLELEPVLTNGTLTGYGSYRQGVFDNGGVGSPDYVESDMKAPVLRGQALADIPFIFINTKDLVAAPDKPSLLGLANAVLTIYRGEADYRQSLFMQGQDTLVIKGELKRTVDPNELASEKDEPVRTGTGSMIHLQGGVDNDAKYIGVSSSGLSEQRTALENDAKRADAKSGALSSNTGDGNAESGEALKTRVGARTASLNSIAITGAAGLEWELRQAAKWMGANPELVKVTPNMEFADYQMSAETLARLMAAKASGAPLSRESIHALMAEGGITKLSFQEEVEKLAEEAADAPPAGTNAGGNPNQDELDGAPDATGAQGA